MFFYFKVLYANSTIYDIIANDLDSVLLYVSEKVLEVAGAEAFATNIKNFYFNGVDPKDKDAVSNMYA